MRICTGMLGLFSLLILGCSNGDDAAGDGKNPSNPIGITAIGADGAALYQYTHDGTQEIGEITNLSNELGLGADYLTLRQVGNTLSFYTFNEGNFSLFQKDVATGEVQTYIDFYTNTAARSIVWGTNDGDTVFFGYYNPEGTTNLAIQNLALENFQGSDLSLEFNIDRLYQPLYHEGRLYITYRSGNLDYKISVYDTVTFALVQTLAYGTYAPSILIDGNGNLAVFKFDETAAVRLEIRDVDALAIIGESNFEWTQRFPPGPMNAEVKDGKVYYGYEYPQPFDLQIGPAVLDLATGENLLLDLKGAIDTIEAAGEISTYVVWQQFDAKQEVFLISYGVFNDGPLLTGGLLVLSPKGLLLDTMELPFVPTYFVK